MKQAFTLVELAIVIVIIGLLVGGVLQGQELIKQSRIRKFAAQNEGFITAIQTFKAKYNAYPGDMPNATQFWGAYGSCPTNVPSTQTATCNGNGDNNIGDWSNGATYYEFYNFWQHLKNAKLVNYGGDAQGSTNSWGPKGVYDASSYGILNATSSASIPGSGGFSGYIGHFFIFGKSTGGHPWYGAIPPEEAYNIDLKYDDGKPGAGQINSLVQGSTYAPNCATTNNATTADYDLSRTSAECSFIIKLNL